MGNISTYINILQKELKDKTPIAHNLLTTFLMYNNHAHWIYMHKANDESLKSNKELFNRYARLQTFKQYNMKKPLF